ncbi:MAG: RNA polymerase sigma factor [Chitinophagales bacterium]
MTTVDFTTRLYEYDPVLRPYAFNLVKSKERTDDLIQDTFYRAIINKAKFTEGTNVKAWLFTIMKNIFINDYRKNQKRGTVTDHSENQYLLNSTANSVKNDSERTFMAEEIDKAMQSVSKEFTEPFLMYFNGFKYQEISDKLALPLGTVKSRIFFARKELQQRLKGTGLRYSDN